MEADGKLAFGVDEVPADIAGKSKVIHMTPHDTLAGIRLAKAARASGTIVSIDIDNVFDGVEDVLENVDILISSVEFPSKFLGISDQRTAIAAQIALQMRNRRRHTGSSRIAFAHRGRDVYRIAGFDVPGGCQDTTGAGDAFRVGLLHGLLTGESVEDSARMANAVAALKCRRVGAAYCPAEPNRTRRFSEKIIDFLLNIVVLF